MDTVHSSQFGGAPGSWRKGFADAVRYWEPRRIAYNAVLAAAALGWVVGTWPHFLPALNLSDGLRFAVLALIANVLYCAAYLVDIPMQCAPFIAAWRRYRWGLWLLGMVLALVLENYWIADEIYPFVR